MLYYFCSLAQRPTEPALAVGCSDNEECPDWAACQNSQCINPCAVGNPCAPTANCKVINHQARCSCPDGYIGSPTTDCKLRKSKHFFMSKSILCMHIFLHIGMKYLLKITLQ